MRFPTQRLTITPAEYLLLRPSLDVLSNGLASAKMGAFPHRHPYHRIDLVASDVYRDQAYDDEMASRITSVRGKLWELLQSRKVRLDAFELAAAALALRLGKDHKPARAASATSAEIKLLGAKIEVYRKRAKRAAIARVGDGQYEAAAERWRKLTAWARYNLLQFKLPRLGRPWRAKLWQEHRQHLALAIGPALTSHFYQALTGQQMTRIVTLMASSLRRCRHPMGIRELLTAPQNHTNFLVDFVVKRINLDRLPGAPVPQWQQITDRADKFKEFKNRLQVPIAEPSTIPDTTQTRSTQAPPSKVPDKPQVNTEPKGGIVASNETLVNAMAQILSQVSEGWAQKRVIEEAKFRILYVKQSKKPTTAKTLNRLIKELAPGDLSADPNERNSQHADWLLRLALDLGREPSFIYNALGAALYRVTQPKVLTYDAQ